MDIAILYNTLKNPYPDLNNVKKNPHYANLLQNDLAGYVSEITAVMQYTYQTFIVEHLSDEFYEIIELIARNEMYHMEELGKAIVALGGNPVFTNCRNQFWNAAYVNYTNNFVSMMNANIDSEKQAIANYEMRIKQINCPPIQELLTRIIEEECIHIAFFEEMREKATMGKGDVVSSGGGCGGGGGGGGCGMM